MLPNPRSFLGYDEVDEPRLANRLFVFRLCPTQAKGSDEEAAEAEGPGLGFDKLANGSMGLELTPAAEKLEA